MEQDMEQITRRALLRTTAVAPIVFAAGCAGISTALTPENVQKLIDNFTTISDAVLAAEPAITTISGMTTSTKNTVNDIMAGIKSVAAEAKTLWTTSAGTTLVQKLEAGVSSLASLSTTLKLPSRVKTILDDALLVMPLVKTAVGLLVPMAGDPVMVDAAMLRLRAAPAALRS